MGGNKKVYINFQTVLSEKITLKMFAYMKFYFLRNSFIAFHFIQYYLKVNAYIDMFYFFKVMPESRFADNYIKGNWKFIFRYHTRSSNLCNLSFRDR